MKYICTYCNLISDNMNLWCQKKQCDFRNLSNVLRPGDNFGEFEIKRLMRVLKTAIIYEAERDGTLYLLKISHSDREEDLVADVGFGAYLKREAQILEHINKRVNSPLFPKLAQPYQHYRDKERSYGRLTFRDTPRYYLVFEHMKGQFLRDYLNDNPQPTEYQSAWFIYDLATIVGFMHNYKVTHWSLSPDVVYLREIDENIRPVLLDFGIYGHNPSQEFFNNPETNRNPYAYPLWLSRFASPAYLAPELLQIDKKLGDAGRKTDVYGLGIIFYELLMGKPLYPSYHRTDEMIIQDVLSQQINTNDILTRKFDLSEQVTDFVSKAMNQNSNKRYSDVSDFRDGLTEIFGKPQLKKERGILRSSWKWLQNNHQEVVFWSITIGLGFLVFVGVLENL